MAGGPACHKVKIPTQPKEGRMGHLYVDLFADGVWNDSVLHFTGDQGDTWHEKVIRLADVVPQTPHRTYKVQLRFRGITATDYDGDICIDDFGVDGVKTPIAQHHHVAAFPRSEIAFKNARINYRNANDRLCVVRLNGAQILDVTVKGSGSIDLSKLSRGVYCVKVGNEIIKILR